MHRYENGIQGPSEEVERDAYAASASRHAEIMIRRNGHVLVLLSGRAPSLPRFLPPPSQMTRLAIYAAQSYKLLTGVLVSSKLLTPF